MTEEKINERFNGSATTIINGLKLWLPMFLALLSLLTSLYTYKIKGEILDEIRLNYVSQSDFTREKLIIDKTTKIVEVLGNVYVTKGEWDKTIPEIVKSINNNDKNTALLNADIKTIRDLLQDVKSELKEIKTEIRK